VILADVAHSRAGDKGTVVNISVILLARADYEWMESFLTPERLREHLGAIVHGEVRRYELPNIAAFNFVFTRQPGQSVTRTLALDAHGKTLSSIVLGMPLPDRPAV
jgi:hypothetical protein